MEIEFQYGGKIRNVTKYAGQDGSVGIATPRIESRWGKDFPHPCRPAVRLTHPRVQRVTCNGSVSRG
jgi:hypothetical protein